MTSFDPISAKENISKWLGKITDGRIYVIDLWIALDYPPPTKSHASESRTLYLIMKALGWSSGVDYAQAEYLRCYKIGRGLPLLYLFRCPVTGRITLKEDVR